MGQIMSMAQSLMGDSPATPTAQGEPVIEAVAPTPPPVVNQSVDSPDWSALLGMASGFLQSNQGGGDNPLSMLSSLDPQLLQLGMSLIGAFTSPMDDKMALLAALRPFVREERFAKVDQAIQIARLYKVAQTGWTLWKEYKERG